MRLSAFVCGVAIAACGTANTQDLPIEQVQRIRTAGVQETRQKPLTKEQLLRVRQLLESAEAGTAALDAASRVVSYAELARAYQVVDRAKAIELLESGLTACRDLQLESSDQRLNAQLKHQLQQRTVRDLAALAPDRLDQLIEQLPADVRALALDPLISYYGKVNRLDRATEMVMSVAQESEMPYASALTLMGLLVRGRQDEVRSLFLSSLASYQIHEHPGLQPSRDFPDMVVKFQDQLPPAVVWQAADEVLAQAKKADEKSGGVNISIAAANGAASFGSAYDYRLFQMASVLRKLDPERAAKLLQDRQDVSTLASKYPDGMNSFRAGDRHGDMSMSFGVGNGPRGARSTPSPGPSVLERQRMAEIVADAPKHPQDALANAAVLSPPLAIGAYLTIARAAQIQAPSVARAALDRASALIDKVPLQQQLINIQQITSVYLQLQDDERAKRSLEQALEVADRLYKKDTNGDDPNRAPKAYWASTNGYKSILADAEKIDPAWAVTLLKEIKDDGIRVFNQVAMAEELIGKPPHDFQIISSFKDGGVQMMFSDGN
jgi:hypothetical protein